VDDSSAPGDARGQAVGEQEAEESRVGVGAAEQTDAADEAGASDGASPLICSADATSQRRAG